VFSGRSLPEQLLADKALAHALIDNEDFATLVAAGGARASLSCLRNHIERQSYTPELQSDFPVHELGMCLFEFCRIYGRPFLWLSMCLSRQQPICGLTVASLVARHGQSLAGWAFRVILVTGGRQIHLSLHSLGAEEDITALRHGQMHPGHHRPVIRTTLHVRGTGEDVGPGARGRCPGFALLFVSQRDAGDS
jgi:hypothetical protein